MTHTKYICTQKKKVIKKKSGFSLNLWYCNNPTSFDIILQMIFFYFSQEYYFAVKIFLFCQLLLITSIFFFPYKKKTKRNGQKQKNKNYIRIYDNDILQLGFFFSIKILFSSFIHAHRNIFRRFNTNIKYLQRKRTHSISSPILNIYHSKMENFLLLPQHWRYKIRIQKH